MNVHYVVNCLVSDDWTVFNFVTVGLFKIFDAVCVAG